LGDCADPGAEEVASGSCEYSVDPERADKARWEEASSRTIRVMTKPCPKCRTSTERDGKYLFTIFTISGLLCRGLN